jgi:outer membrane protein OmpA-like peptidoglycan-associated protein
MTRFVRNSVALVAVAALSVGSTACSGMTQAERGAVIGAAGGAAAGAAVGRAVGSTARGAIIGAAVGGAAGAVIGQQMDRRQAELEGQLAGADVIRVGEGLVIRFESGLLFPFDSDQLLPAAQDNLRRFAQYLRQNENQQLELLIVGHTDSVGTAAYNQGLSERRAAAAARYLVAQGVPTHRIRTEGRGLHEPVATNATAEGRQLNRRVEVALFADEAYRQEMARQYGTR